MVVSKLVNATKSIFSNKVDETSIEKANTVDGVYMPSFTRALSSLERAVESTDIDTNALKFHMKELFFELNLKQRHDYTSCDRLKADSEAVLPREVETPLRNAIDTVFSHKNWKAKDAMTDVLSAIPRELKRVNFQSDGNTVDSVIQSHGQKLLRRLNIENSVIQKSLPCTDFSKAANDSVVNENADVLDSENIAHIKSVERSVAAPVIH